MSSLSKFRFEVARIELQPGDMLAVRFPDNEPMSDNQVQYAMSQIKTLLPKGVGVAWFRGNVSIGVIRPGDPSYGTPEDAPAPEALESEASNS